MTAPHRHVVFFVDDCADLRDAFGRLLAARGYEVRAAATGFELMTLLTAGNHPCLVLLDEHMPGMSGTDVESRMRRTPTLRTIPIVIMSGDTESTVRGCPLLVKPCDAQELFAAVEAHARCPAAGADDRPPPRLPRRHGPALQRHMDRTVAELRARLAETRELQRIQARIVERFALGTPSHAKRRDFP